MLSVFILVFFFFQAEDGIRDVAVTGVQTCALPIFRLSTSRGRTTPPLRTATRCSAAARPGGSSSPACRRTRDRKSTRLNSSHGYISYAVFCLKKKNNRRIERELITRSTNT